mmetsp:Transcript_16714/g.35900  ORF Transcript_16714/g.35900 Transcript_16714/m.35900 type:complete len:447 (+) Transcript_16714:269-1609(+)
MAKQGVGLVVRNTFLETDDQEEDDGPPERTVSDQTGLTSKTVLQLGRKPNLPEPIPEQAPVREEDEEEDEDEEEEDDGPLARTQSSAPTPVVLTQAIGTSSNGSKLIVPNTVKEADDEDEEQDSPFSMPLTRAQSSWPAYTAFGQLPMGQPDMSKVAAELQKHVENQGPEAMQQMWGMQGGGMPWMMMPYGLPGAWGMYGGAGNFPGGGRAEDDKEGGGCGGSSSSSWPQPSSDQVPPLGQGPPLGMLHAFHSETQNMGIASPDFRQFSKIGYEGRLSVVTEKEVHSNGVQRYLVQFMCGELSKADGVGFVFSPKLPCAKNIQRIVSIFVNQSGRICMRIFADIIRASAYVKPLELGDWVEMAIDLEGRVATFNIWANTENGWPDMVGKPVSTAVFPYGQRLGKLDPEHRPEGAKTGKSSHKPIKLNVGHLACVVKNVGVTINLAS